MKKLLSLLCLSLLASAQQRKPCTPQTKSCCASSIKTPDIGPMYTATYPFLLPDLPYGFDALEPYIDKETMQIHHNKHHQGYVNNLNAALKDHPELHDQTLFALLSDVASLPRDLQNAIRNQGGGHFNHSLFWTIMSPKADQKPTGQLVKAIDKAFGSFDNMQKQFNAKAKTVFGSGWAWLVTDKKGNLSILATHNQDSPVQENLIPILGLDVWEHAYYLKYKNRRGDYITAWWHVINWPQVQSYYQQALTK